MLPKCKAHVESFDGQTKCLYFFDWKWELIRKHYTIWDKVNSNV